MIGREHELALLLGCWAQAQAGEGQAVLLVGEAGIGKSRLARALADAPSVQTHEHILWQCSAHHAGSALCPVIQRLGRTIGVATPASTDAILDKLESLVGHDQEPRPYSPRCSGSTAAAATERCS